MTNFNFSPWSTLVAQQGEDAVYHIEVWTVAVTNADGLRWLYCGPVATHNEDEAAELATAMHGRVNGDAFGNAPTRANWTPDNEHWTPGPAVYGGAHHARVGDRGVFGDVEPELLASTR